MYPSYSLKNIQKYPQMIQLYYELLASLLL